jgi:hypothetical protein
LLCITGHGYGHATRCRAVLRELLRLCPSLQVTVSTTVPGHLFESGIAGSVSWREQDYEPGTVQKNCFEVDTVATRAAYTRYLAEREDRVSAEVDFLRAGDFHGVLADIPAVPLAAASTAGIPAAGLWNFTWDWILEPILGGERGGGLESLVALLQADYATAALHLRLPFSTRETDLEGVEDVPLVGRKSSMARDTVLERVGLDTNDSRPLVLVAMGGWECRTWSPIAVEGCLDVRFLVVGDVPVRLRTDVTRVPVELGAGYAFSDLVAVSDVVLSKPGYGIASECVLNRTPLLGVERRGFREAPELVRDMKAFGPFDEISLADFFAGRWERALLSLLESDQAWQPVPEDGAQVVARRLCEYFGL